MTLNFQLSQTLLAHNEDVKCLSTSGNDKLLTGSRDRSAALWNLQSKQYVRDQLYQDHAHFVNAVLITASGSIVTASYDKSIKVYSSQGGLTLVGHSENVCGLSELDGSIFSCSWDKTAKMWVDGVCKVTFTGHQAAVWSVLPVGDGTVLTASADKTCKLWDIASGKCIQTYSGHVDVVRGLTLISDLPGHFASCSNDGTLRIWSLDGKCHQVLIGHTSFVYNVKSLPQGELVSCGEDRSVRGTCYFNV